MKLDIINPPQLYDPTDHGYSHAVRVTDLKGIAYIAGQGGHDPDGHLATDFADQVTQSLQNLQHAISGVGGDTGNLLKTTVYIVDYTQARLDVLNRQLVPFMRDNPPAQSLVQVPRLALDGMLIEIDAVVALP